METCQRCYHPADGHTGRCPYHKGKSIKYLLRERGISRTDFMDMGAFSARTVARIHSGERQLSELELRGLMTIEPILQK